VGRTSGVVLDPSGPVGPEAIVERLDQIRDTSQFSIPKDVMAMLSDVFSFRFEYGGAHREP
jgi:hypothetical protein